MSQKKSKQQSKKKSIKKTKKGKSKATLVFNSFNFYIGLGIFLFTFLLYANTLGHEFALDDNSVLADSHIVRGGAGKVGEIFQTRYRQGTFGDASTTYRPVSIAMFATEWSISPDNPSIHHFFNVFFYAWSCLFLFLTFRNVLDKYSIWIPLIATLLFAVHPVHTEVVANIKGRDEIMTLFFGILALNLVWKYVRTEDMKYWILGVLSYTGALFSKENAVNFVALIPLTLFFFSKWDLGKIGKVFLSFLVPTILFIAIRSSILGSTTGLKNTPHLIDNFLYGAPDFISQKATAMLVMGKYLLLLLVPYPLVCDYNYNYIPITSMADWKVILSILIHIGLFGYALKELKKKTFLSYAILFYFVCMALYCNLFIVIGAGMGERFLFLSSLGFCLGVAYLLSKYLGGGTDNIETNDVGTLTQGKNLLMGIVAGVCLIYAYMTFDRNWDWYDSFSLYEADLPKAPESARLHGYMGTEFMKRGKDSKEEEEKQAYYDKAIEVYKKAVEIYPDYTEAKGQLGLGYFRKNDRATAAAYYEDAIKDSQCKGSIYSNYGTMHFLEYQRLAAEGKTAEAQQRLLVAKDLFEKGVAREANYSDGWMNLGSTYGTMNDHAKAIEHFKKALSFDPENKAQINFFIGTAYKNLGNMAEANKYFKIAGTLDKQYQNIPK